MTPAPTCWLRHDYNSQTSHGRHPEKELWIHGGPKSTSHQYCGVRNLTRRLCSSPLKVRMAGARQQGSSKTELAHVLPGTKLTKAPSSPATSTGSLTTGRRRIFMLSFVPGCTALRMPAWRQGCN